ncbi:MAG TPA: DUF1349 domain-containing protein [Planctomycetaceae bacterium]|jgi:regulation of enolase protein 1 (concanavalin A-like superfamily)|nr:DUF1349 domain-containing protein [Planctomycetaceae bacterium]
MRHDDYSNPSSPGESKPIELIKRRVEQLIAAQDWGNARVALKKYAPQLTGDADATAWYKAAANRIVSGAKDADNQQRLIQTAQRLIDAHDYEQAQSLLSSVAPKDRARALGALLTDVEETLSELDSLELDLIDAIRRDQLDEIKAIIDRLLELRPWHKLAQLIKDNLTKLRLKQACLVIDATGAPQFHDQSGFRLSSNAWGLAAIALVGLILLPTIWLWNTVLKERPMAVMLAPASQPVPVLPIPTASAEATMPNLAVNPATSVPEGSEAKAVTETETTTASSPASEPQGFDLLQRNLFAPVKGTELVVSQNRATLKVAAAVHDLSIELGQMTAPRALESVSGDFEYQVRVSNVTGPRGRSLQASRTAFVGAGILVMADDRNYIRLERAALNSNNRSTLYASWEQRGNGRPTRMGSSRDKPLSSDSTWLRVQRRQNQILGAVSEDGTSWHALPALTVNWPQNIQVGIAAVNNTPVGYEAVFDNRVLTRR